MGVRPAETRIFQVARTSLPAIFTLEAARASANDMSDTEQLTGEFDVPLAFLRDMIDAVIKIGLFKITPGNAKLVHTANRPIRYSKSPRVFHVARFARGT